MPLAPTLDQAPALTAEGNALALGLRRLLAPRAAYPYAWVLLLRFALLNVVGLMLSLAAWQQGFVAPLFAADASGLCVVIALAFLVGLGLCGWRVVQISGELNEAHARSPAETSRSGAYLGLAARLDSQGRANLAASLRLKLASRLAPVRHIAGCLVMLGLIGTVIGFMIALSGVDPEGAADVSAIAPMVSDLIVGMSVALSTTLVGAVLNLWLMLAYRLLDSGAVRLATCLAERAEAVHGNV